MSVFGETKIHWYMFECADYCKDDNYTNIKGLITCPVCKKKLKRTKYNSVISYVNGIKFHSKKEANRYAELLLLVKAGEIRDLKLQVKYSLDVSGVHICNYYADFVYIDCRFETTVVEDVKGMKSGGAYSVFKLKEKLMLAIHKIDIFET
jgi:hypothetical protein